MSAPQSLCATLQRILSIGNEPARGSTTSHEVATARLWRTRDEDPLSRTLQGEIPVTISLFPGFLFPTIRLGVRNPAKYLPGAVLLMLLTDNSQYAVNIAISAPGFKLISPVQSTSSPVPYPPSTIISLPVKIIHNTSAPNGDRTSYAPAPAYDAPAMPSDPRPQFGLQVPPFHSFAVIPVISGAG